MAVRLFPSLRGRWKMGKEGEKGRQKEGDSLFPLPTFSVSLPFPLPSPLTPATQASFSPSVCANLHGSALTEFFVSSLVSSVKSLSHRRNWASTRCGQVLTK